MKYVKQLIAIIFLLIVNRNAIYAQQMYSPQNVDQTAATFFDGIRTFRALQYYTDMQLTNKVYRLETTPENGFPAITLQGKYQGNPVFFEDKPPFNAIFEDNPTPYSSFEATQLLWGFQAALKVLSDRFNWKGLDGSGVRPIKIFLANSDEEPDKPPVWASYLIDGSVEEFTFRKSVIQNSLFNGDVATIAHEISHAIFHQKTGIEEYSLCTTHHVINEGIADILGIYVKNKVKPIGPNLIDWNFNSLYYFGDPKTITYFPDTYNGQYYAEECSQDCFYSPSKGVSAKWFYLLCQGFIGQAYNDLGYGYSNLTGIGIEKGVQIVWETIPKIKENCNYPQFCKLTLETAGQLYGLNSTEYIAVKNAWCAVGVCDNNLPAFSMSPANGTSFIDPWPSVDINLTWANNNLVQEWVVQMSPKYDFSDSVQTVKLTNFSTVIGPNQTLMNTATAKGYFRPGKKVYARAKISQAGLNFCKGLNPLCILYQKFGPTHAFWLKDQKVQFWPANTSASVKAWNGQLTWKSIADTELYELQVASDPSFNAIIYNGFTQPTGSFTETGQINAVLDIGQTYYARARATRLNLPILKDNNGAWSNMLTITAAVPSTAIIQAKTQKLNAPPLQVSTIGRQVSWDAVPGATNFVIQVAKDDAFNNIVWSTTVTGNLTSTPMLFPPMPNLTDLFVRVIPNKTVASGTISGVCSNIWRIKTNETAALPVMTNPANGTSFPFMNFAGNDFGWKSGTLNMNTVDHFELHLTKTGGATAIFPTQGKVLNFFVKDPLLYNATGLQARVLAVNSLGAKTGLSLPFNYTICPDHPAVFFPGDLGKVDPTKDFKVEWFASKSFPPGSQNLVSIKEGGINPVPGFTDKPTTANFMLVPAGTLTNGKNYTVTVKNSSSCPALPVPTTFFFAVGSGGSNQPQPPKLVNFTIEVKGFRNDPDALSIPPAYGTSNYELGIELIDPDGNVLALLDPNGMQVTKLLVDSENSGVILVGNNRPQGKYKLRPKLAKIFPPNTYYPFDQPRFSVFLNGQAIILNHIITIDLFNPGSSFDEWKDGFQFADVILDIK